MTILSIFWQIITDSITSTISDPTPAAQPLSLWYLIKEGGLLMIPLGICSILMCYVFVERWLNIKKASQLDPNFLHQIKTEMMSGNLNGAKNIAARAQGPVARMIEKGISRLGKPIDHIEKSMENTGKLEVYKMEQHMGVLSTIAGIAPMFGFLGTIAGMIILFYNIQTQGFALESIAGGIYTKMVTSAVGLIIGLISYVCYNYLNALINRNVNKMEAASAEFIDILHEPAVK